MRTKNILVSFLAVLAVFALVATVSAVACDGDLVQGNDVTVKVDGESVDSYNTVAVEAGETISVKVIFTSDVYDSDVTVEAELEGNKVDVQAVSDEFDVEIDSTYRETLTLKVPYELKDELSDELELNIEIDGKDYSSEVDTIYLRVQRPSYNIDIKSVSVDQSVDAGETFPVEIVLKNIGYNDLDDLYVTAQIEALGVKKTGYFGDVVALECDDGDDGFDVNDDGIVDVERSCDEDDEDSVSGKLYLEVPYGVQAGLYTLEVIVENDDTTSRGIVQIVVDNDFETTVFKSGDSVWIVNPTDNVVGYRIVAESPAMVNEPMVFVPAGASQTIKVDPNTEGEYNFSVNVFTTNGELIETITFSGNNGADEQTDATNPIVILTVILAIIFIVLLIVLIVLISKKPEKSGELGESYY